MDDQLAQTDEVWPAVVEESQRLAAEYEDAGWDVITTTPGDVVPVPQPGDSEISHVGLDVLVGGDVYEQVETAVETADFDAIEVFREESNGIVYLAVVLKAPKVKQAICLPLYYRVAEAERLFSLVDEGEQIGTRIRPLSGDGISFAHDDPDLLLPDAR